MFEDFLIVIFFLIIGLPMVYYSFKEISWYLNEDKYEENFRLDLMDVLLKQGYQVLSVIPERNSKEKNPFENGLKWTLPGFFGSAERSFCWIVRIKKSNSGEEKKVWAEVTQSLFLKTEFKFHPKIE